MSTMLADYARAMRGFNRNARLVLWYYVPTSFTYGVSGVLLNLFLLKRGLDETFLGSMVLAQSIAMSALIVPLGILADRMPKERLLKAGYFLMGIPYLLVAQVKSPLALLILWAVQGLGLSCSTASDFPYLAENASPESRTHLFSMAMAILSTVASLGMVIGGYLPGILAPVARAAADSVESYRYALLIAAGVYWLSGFAVLRLGRRPTNEDVRTGEAGGFAGACDSARALGHTGFLRALTVPAIAALILNTGLQAMGAGFFLPFMNVILSLRFGLSARSIGWILMAQYVLVSLGSLTAPHLSRNRDKVATMALWQVFAIPAVLAMAVVRVLPVFVISIMMRTILMTMVEPLVSSTVMEKTRPGERGFVNSTVNLFRNVSWGLGGRWGGIWLRSRAYAVPMLVAAMLYAVGAGLLTASNARSVRAESQ